MSSSHPPSLLRLCGLLAWLLLLTLPVAQAQQRPDAPPSTRRCAWVRLTPGRDTTFFGLRDTLTIVPASVSVEGRAVRYDAGRDQYRFLRPTSRFPHPEPGRPDIVLAAGTDSVLVCYRVLPLQLSAAHYLRPRRLMDSLRFWQRPSFGENDFSVKEQILSTPGINKTGNLSRGVSFGNAQNVFVNSSLNLQLDGKLTDQINLTAAISDQNVPFQPEGNTQQLQEFDRIYITLTHPRWSLTAGDVVLRNKPDYFLRFYKNIQGAAAEVNFGQLPTGGFGGGVGQGVSNQQLLPYPNAAGGSAGTFLPTPPTVAPAAGSGQPPPDPYARPGAAPGTLTPNGTGPNASQTVTTRAEGQGPRRALLSTKTGEAFATTSVAAGGAKGKFASIDIAPLENVQGPYRLRGPNGEQFIIVLANSERVYLDGRLLVRGFDADYIIDYNQAELTFSPRHLITRNTRIKVDYEYSDFNYARSLLQASHYQQLGRLQVHANFYRESDNPDNSPNLTLSEGQKALLRRSGNVSRVTAPGDTLVRYDRQQIQYRREIQPDPATQQPVNVFVYPPLDTLALVYNVQFTNLGAGRGSYNLSPADANANGRVYTFVGQNRGSYEPVRVLPTPLQKQLLTVGTSYALDSTATVFVDLASSELDLNRFSPEKAQGQAMRVGYLVQDRRVRLPGMVGYRLRSSLDYEYTSRRFAPIDRYRDIEFDRNWSVDNTLITNNQRPREENILNASVGLVKDADNAVGYRLSRRYRAGEVSGLQHWVDAARQVGRVQMRGNLFLLNSTAGRRESRWARGEATARYVGGAVVPGYAYRFDKNRVARPGGDSLTSANYYDEHALFVQSRDTARIRYRLDYSYRRDQTPNQEQTSLREQGRAQTWQGTLNSRLSATQDLAVLATYRDLLTRDTTGQTAPGGSVGMVRERTVLGKLDWNASFLQNVVRSELSYAVGTGRELRRDFAYLAVPNGQGTHYWNDLDGNGRQEKNEFFEAQTPDAQFRTYIKVFLPTDDYLPAFTNRFSYRLTLTAPRAWREATGWRELASRFSTLTTVTLDRKSTENTLNARLNPFAFQTADSLLLSLNKLLRNTLYFNRSNPIFGAELTVQQTQQKVLLTQGFDTRNLASQSLLLRRTLAQSFTGRLSGTRSIRENQSDYLPARNFRVEQYEAAPEVSYQPSQVWRFTTSYLYTTKRNTAGPNEDTRGTFHDLGLETRISQVGKRTVSATARFVRVGFAGDQASLVGLEILNALRPGSNYTWNLNLEQRLSNGLNVTLAYDGRKPQSMSPIHTGRMQVAVLF
ncbi:hypothetical protein [Hymenobacter rubripertinctus]|uniref:Cell surface protein SprA n=1 Tax=Hymenobacter rubripertinctus TaxID=2029981 RepID=A0A418R4A9_9BACT|nr:hypothetical protein [Hymenobacter rubripertinctus]RIY12179.1 hypothetical protein D0T11_05930 [Hymenobacter rubripertinctus]